MRNLATLAIVGLALICAPASADPVAKPPTDKWIVDFDDAQCIAMRNYGSSDSPLFLVFKQPVLGDVMQLSIVRRGTGGRFAERHGASISWDGGKSIWTTAVSSADATSRNVILQMNLDRPTFSQLSQAKIFHLRVNGQIDASFQLAQMDDVLKILDQCVVDLDRVWNVAPKGTTSPQLQRPSQGTLQGIFRPDDYPSVAANGDQSGTVSFALLIDEAGKVADCTVIKTSGIAALDAQSCFVVKERAHFTPAIGADGRPAKDARTASVTWLMAN